MIHSSIRKWPDLFTDIYGLNKLLLHTKGECKKWITEAPKLFIQENTKPVEGQPGKKTIENWMEEWLQKMQYHLRPGTYRDYARFTKNYIIQAFGKTPMRELSRKQVNALYQKLLDDGVKIPTVRYVNRVLHSALESALAEEEILVNPAHKTKVPKLEEKEM